MKIIILGAPGAGKGTQATRVRDKYKVTHISTGDILRKNISEGTPLGLEAKKYVDGGLLVPDSVIMGLVESAIGGASANGFLLDGFPRSIKQAEKLSEITGIDKVINLLADKAKLVARITGRRMCKCGESYHISWGIGDICSKCGGKLYQRDDDTEEAIEVRMDVYNKQTAPLIDYYTSKGILCNIDSMRNVEEVFADVNRVLDDIDKN